MEHSVILSAARTPLGSFQGALKTLRAPDLGAVALRAAVQRAGIDAGVLDEVIMGCVLTAALGQSPARQAMLGAGIPESVGVLTVNRVCSSGLKAVMLADQMIRCGDAQLLAAGGMESMTNAPYCIPGAREGLRMGDAKLVDTMVCDGLWDFFTNQHMGSCADMCAAKYGFTREAQDAFAKLSYEKARDAMAKGTFRDEIVPVELTDKKGKKSIVDTDEEPGRAQFEKMLTLKPSFTKDGTVTAANASGVSDGAAALIVASATYAKEKGLKPLARIVAHAGYSQAPEWFTTAPVGAIRKTLEKAGLTPNDIDLWEINEAFSCVAMAAVKEYNLSMDRVNIHGGAVALGHPIGASGARILTTLLYGMKKTGARRGLATLCNGGGEATALIVEII